MKNKQYFHDSFGGEADQGKVADTIIMVNNPLDVDLLSTNLQEIDIVANHYEFYVRTGSWNGNRITLCSTGIGGGSAAIAVDNIINLGGKTIIYVDFNQTDNHKMEIYVGSGAIRLDGASLDYVSKDFPAIADPEILMAVLASGKRLGYEITPALLCPSVGAIINDEGFCDIHEDIINYCSKSKQLIVFSNPEIATILTLCSIYKIRSGAIYAIGPHSDINSDSLNMCFNIALTAVDYLFSWDNIKAKNSWRVMTPEI